MKNKVIVRDLGEVSYAKAWDYQTGILETMKTVKLENRKLDEPFKSPQKNYFLLCEHPHVYTLGKSGSEDHLLIKAGERSEKGVEYFKINRGGDITYHGPGQIVGYPILDLDMFFTDVHKYVRFIEETIMRTLKEYDIQAMRVEGFTGVWIQKKGYLAKICAIGVHLSRWITMHGFALNVNSDLSYFNHIVPCGIVDEDKKVTSMALELGSAVDIGQVKERIKYHFSEIFNVEFINE